LAGRKAFSVQNQSGVEIKVNFDNTVVGYVGTKMAVNAERFYDASAPIILYAKSLSGTVNICVEEIA
jgi:hypothetical protein